MSTKWLKLKDGALLNWEFNYSTKGTFDGEKGKYKWPFTPWRTLALKVDKENAAKAVKLIH